MREFKLICFALIAFQCNRDIKPPRENIRLTLTEILEQKNFKISEKMFSVFLSFENGTYKLDIGSEGYYSFNSGKYVINENTITLLPVTCLAHGGVGAQKVACTETFNRGVCKPNYDSKSIQYSITLICSSETLKQNKIDLHTLHFQVLNSRRKSGEIINADGTSIVILGRIIAKVTETVNIRAYPSIKAERQTYFPIDESQGEFLPSIPAGTKIFLLGRTVEKQKVQNWEDYWYVAEAGQNHRAWIFGKFIKESEP